MDDGLDTHLAELEALIHHARSDGKIDDGERAELAALVEKVRTDLGAEEPDDDGLDDKLADAAVRFESDHPKLAGAIRQISDALSGYGI